MVASSPATVSLAACSGETPQRTLCRNRPSLPTARKACVSPTKMVALEGTTESAGESCAKTSRLIMLMLSASSARTAAHVTFRISSFPRISTSLGYVWRGDCESYLGDGFTNTLTQFQMGCGSNLERLDSCPPAAPSAARLQKHPSRRQQCQRE